VRIKNLIELKKTQERHRTLFKSMDEGFCAIEVIFDKNKVPVDYRLLEINGAFEKQTGLKNARGRLMRDLAPDYEQYWFDIYGKIALTGESARFENRAEALGRWYEVYAFRVEPPENRQVAVFFNDITSRKQTQISLEEAKQELARANEQLAKTNEELEQRVEKRTASLSDAIAQMEEFSYTVSHDLRAPLRGMQAYSEELLEDCGEILAAKPDAIEYLKRIAENAARLDKMVCDVLMFSRIARGEFRIEPVSVDKVVQELVDQSPAMRRPYAEIQIEPLADVLGHETSLTQAISNLLTNAIKFVAPGTIPKIRIWSEKRDQEVRIWIEDNGIGIDPKFHHRLFRMFERIHPDLSYEGTGVGLALVRKAAGRMNGKAGVESDGSNGSRFWIQLRGAR
jgi:signal transduction histidine kinase